MGTITKRNITTDNSELPIILASAYQQVILSIQDPGEELILRRSRYTPQTFWVEGQAHDRLKVDFGLTQYGPLGYVP